MPRTTTPPDTARPDAAALNERIRAFTAGRSYWSPEALAELARMRAEWQAAVQVEEAA
ncbi:hypothetical protein OG900_33005 [Streptomyces sp. NBC_00433]